MKNILIVGGGIEGLSAAALLSEVFGGLNVKITLLNGGFTNGAYPEVISANPSILDFHQRLRMSEKEFVAETDTLFKTADVFVGRDGSQYHGYGQYGASLQGYDFSSLAVHQKLSGDHQPFSRYSLSAVASQRNRFCHPVANEASPLSTLRYSYVFSAEKYERLLQGIVQAKKVEILNGPGIDSAVVEHGVVSGIRLVGGEVIAADFFIDCTGADSGVFPEGWFDSDFMSGREGDTVTLYSGPLETSRPRDSGASWEQFVPGCRAKFSFSRSQGELEVCTQSGDMTTIAKNVIQDEYAAEQFLRGVKSTTVSQGMRSNPWAHNCIAIGASAAPFVGFSGARLQFLQYSILRLADMLPLLRDAVEPLAKEYNTQLIHQYVGLCDYFELQSYLLNFRHCESSSGAGEVSAAIKEKLALFLECGRWPLESPEVIPQDQWISLCLTFDCWPHNDSPKLHSNRPSKALNDMVAIANVFSEVASKMPTLERYIDGYINGIK